MSNNRGSVWRKWDFHVHTPFSVLYNKFGDDFDNYVKVLFKTAIDKQFSSMGITDYFTIEGYKKIKTEYLENDEKLEELFSSDEIMQIKNIYVFPNIEFRLHELIQNKRVNFHVIFSGDINIQDIEEHFLHDLDFVHESEPFEKDKTRKLKLSNLAALGKELKKEHSEFQKYSDLYVGMLTATIQHKDISERLLDIRFKNKNLIGVPPDEDLSKLDWSSQAHLVRKQLIQKSNVLFASNPNTIEWALGKKNKNQDEFIWEFKSLKPCLWGSDAHDFENLLEPSLERYCWIKADNNFDGLRQIIFEPEERVYIGKEPEILGVIRNNPTKYFYRLEIKTVDGYTGENGKWFSDISIDFNYGLCAIIGNKGKGKSAVADILGLLGNSIVSLKKPKDKLFSFLNRTKFCKKGFAENFYAILYWNDGKASEKNLNDNIDETEYQRIKYIPQKYFEDLCSTEEDDDFKNELNNVVFSRVEAKDKLGKKTFIEYIEYRTELIQESINKLTNNLSNLNEEIIDLEGKDSEQYKISIDKKIKAKKDELDAHIKIKENLKEVKNPAEDEALSKEQKEKSSAVLKLAEEINNLEKNINEKVNHQERLEIEKHELTQLLEEIDDIEAFLTNWKNETKEIAEKYQLDLNQIVKLKIDKTEIFLKRKSISDELVELNKALSKQSLKEEDIELSLLIRKDKLSEKKLGLEKELEKPFKAFHDYQEELKEWQNIRNQIVGDEETLGSLKFLQAEKEYIDKALKQDIRGKKEERVNLTICIFREKKEIQKIYNSVKASISELLITYSKEQQITLETSFKIENEFYSKFFNSFVKRYKDFYQNSDKYLHELTLKYNFDNENDVMDFIDELLQADKILKDNENEFLDYLFSLDYLNPRYNLRLNNKELNELSPGERGGLLLIFYLILDKDNKPLIIDQPEDNLDNQSVSEILVPYIREAKRRRQIVMVTHNPNLAVVADADQIIRMNIDKEKDYEVSHISGGIENSSINKAVVDILEGKMKAFNNRRLKYQNR